MKKILKLEENASVGSLDKLRSTCEGLRVVNSGEKLDFSNLLVLLVFVLDQLNILKFQLLSLFCSIGHEINFISYVFNFKLYRFLEFFRLSFFCF